MHSPYRTFRGEYVVAELSEDLVRFDVLREVLPARRELTNSLCVTDEGEEHARRDYDEYVPEASKNLMASSV